MRMYWISAILLMAACGDKPEPAPPKTKTAAPAAEPVDRRPVIAAFGDSLSAGFGVDSGRSYPDFLQRELDRRGLHYHVVNAGISGDTSSDGVERLDQVTSLQPAFVILELGANDGLRGLPVSVTRANLERIIQGLQQAHARVVLAGMTLPPNYGPDYIGSFQRIFPELAAKYKLPLIAFLLDGVGGHPEYMQPDGLHPNVAGNRRVAQNVLRTLAPLL